MVLSGNLLFPTFNGELRPDKPILIYWLMSMAIGFLGPTESACRMWAVLAVTATALGIYAMGRRLLSPRSGVRAMVVFFLSFQVLINGSAATTDSLMLAWITLAMLAFAWSLPHGPSPAQTALMAVGLGLALLTKGPIGLAIPLLAMAATLWLLRAEQPALGRYARAMATAVGLAVAPFVAWLAAADAATGGDYLRLSVRENLLAHALTPLESHGGNFLLFLPYYVPVVLIAFLPWTLYLPGVGALVCRKGYAPSPGRAVILGWAGVTFVLMTLIRTKLPHYIQPILPALALAVAAAIEAAERGRLDQTGRRWLLRGAWLFAPLALAAAVFVTVTPWLIPVPGLRPAGLFAGAVIVAGAFVALRVYRRGLFARAACWLAAAMTVLYAALPPLIAAPVEGVKIAPRLARAIRHRVGPETPVAMWRFHEPSLVFYLFRGLDNPVEKLEREAQAIRWAGETRPGVLVMPRNHLDDIERRTGPLKLEVIASAAGFNYSDGRWMEVVALERRASPASGGRDIRGR
jgi:4-amino-4-deoxy-L-arabinose transferase-like glycosyltransferase